MATIRARTTSKGERRYQAIVRREGFPDKVATFPARRDAERWARLVEGEFAKGRHLPTLEAERHTLAELLDRFEPELTEKRRKAIGYQLDWWRAELGDKKLSELTPSVLRHALDRLATEPYSKEKPIKPVRLTPRPKQKEGHKPKTYTRTPATVNRYKEALSKVLSVAEREYEWLPENTLAKIPDRKEPLGRVRFLSAEERQKLLDACGELSPDLYALVLCALCTGARAGELLSLTWRDVDLGRRLAFLNRTKNEERRALTLTGPALDVLKERSRVRRIDTDRVFPHPSGTGPYDYQKLFREACAKAGIEDFRFHDLRHTTASYLAMNGATTAEIAAILGHKTLAMVKRYAHLSDQHVSDVVERMTGKVFGSSA